MKKGPGSVDEHDVVAGVPLSEDDYDVVVGVPLVEDYDMVAGSSHGRNHDVVVGVPLMDDRDAVVSVPLVKGLDVLASVPLGGDHDLVAGVPLGGNHDAILGMPLMEAYDMVVGVPFVEVFREKAYSNPTVQNRHTRGASAKGGRKPLGQILIENGIITEVQLEQVLEVQEKKGGFLGRLLFEMGIVEHDKIMEFLLKEKERKVSYVNLLTYPISKGILMAIPKEICLNYRLLAMDKLGTSLTVAMVDPLDEAALEAVQERCPGLNIKVMMCNWSHYKKVVAHVYGERLDEEEVFKLPTFGILAKQFGKAKRSVTIKGTPPR